MEQVEIFTHFPADVQRAANKWLAEKGATIEITARVISSRDGHSSVVLAIFYKVK